MDYKLVCPRDWVRHDATKSDFENHCEVFYNYIPRNELPGVNIVEVIPTNTNTKRCCRWQVVFDYVHHQQIGACEFIKGSLNRNAPRNARQEGVVLIREQPASRYSITYLVYCEHTKLDFLEVNDDAKEVIFLFLNVSIRL